VKSFISIRRKKLKDTWEKYNFISTLRQVGVITVVELYNF
jgi:DNA-binding response OmpR family regulator